MTEKCMTSPGEVWCEKLDELLPLGGMNIDALPLETGKALWRLMMSAPKRDREWWSELNADTLAQWGAN